MGTYRFILAILVLLSHTSFSIFGYNQGVVAVISFFLLSGFTMEALMEKYYGEKQLIKHFYFDRVFRLYPHYCFYFIITLILNFFIPVNESINMFIKDTSLINIFQNIFILPLGYYMYNGLNNCIIVPTAWTLGLELTFYLVFPIIYLKNKKNVCFIISIIIFVIAYLGIINSDTFGYRLLPGTLFIFLIGSIIKSNKCAKCRKTILFSWGISLLLLINLYVNPKYQLPYNNEVLLGILIGIPMLLWLKDIRMPKIDNLLGNLSYGIYLNNFFIMYIMGKRPSNNLERVELIITSILLSYIVYKVIEEPLMKIRKRYRKKVLNENSIMKSIHSQH